MSAAFALSTIPIATVVAYAAHFGKVFLLGSALDNAKPRDLECKDVPKERRERALRLQGCHLNMIETLGIYAGGIVAAIVAGVPVTRITIAAAMYIVIRVIYLIVYAAPQVFGGFLRTGVFGLAMAVIMWLWVEAAVAANRSIA